MKVSRTTPSLMTALGNHASLIFPATKIAFGVSRTTFRIAVVVLRVSWIVWIWAVIFLSLVFGFCLCRGGFVRVPNVGDKVGGCDRVAEIIVFDLADERFDRKSE